MDKHRFNIAATRRICQIHNCAGSSPLHEPLQFLDNEPPRTYPPRHTDRHPPDNHYHAKGCRICSCLHLVFIHALSRRSERMDTCLLFRIHRTVFHVDSDGTAYRSHHHYRSMRDIREPPKRTLETKDNLPRRISSGNHHTLLDNNIPRRQHIGLHYTAHMLGLVASSRYRLCLPPPAAQCLHVHSSISHVDNLCTVGRLRFRQHSATAPARPHTRSHKR